MRLESRRSQYFRSRSEHFQAGEEVTPETLQGKRPGELRYDVLKVLGNGEISKKLTVSAHRFSTSAREKIEKAGGTIVELPGIKPVVKNKMKSAKKK